MSASSIDLLKTDQLQRKASDPRNSAWVRANAGSGKTHVLTQRVIRLLLRGEPPSKILCLTFTKAAAANMSLRIFRTLAAWTTLPDADLRIAIQATGAAVPATLDDARRLFVRAVETPGGLKVQTIHAFCERLLHLFPFEANVSARFEAIDEETQQLLMDEARRSVMSGSEHLPARIGPALALIAEETGSDGFEALLQQIIGKRAAIRHAGGLQDNELRMALGAVLGVPGDRTPEDIIQDITDNGLSADRAGQIVAELMQSSTNDRKLGGKIRDALQIADAAERAQDYVACFFKADGDRPKQIVTKNISAAVRADLEREQDRVEALRDALRASETLARTQALYVLGDAVLTEYERLKGLRGFLDFDDMIERTRTLLTRSDAQWVLYKLDSGIDHILVDEAQDTSPAQWAILKSLTEEFFSGQTARSGNRTFFAVGDEKQSIFSFQGAAPHEFGTNRKFFRQTIEDIKLTFEDVELQESFRSSRIVLEAVDKIFKNADNGAGLTSDGVVPPHSARKSWLPGYIELWPLIGKDDEPVPDGWMLPLDALRANDPAAIMANRVASSIASLLDPAIRHGVFESKDVIRPVAPGDIMILVRKRGRFFNAVIRALKERNIPVAGADRIRIADHIAVMDLLAAGKAALLPLDDLTIATVLKCPLIGLDDSDLIELAPHRSGSLFAALQASGNESHRRAAERIAGWQALARRATPFEFYAEILGRQGGRRAMLARLGPEAGDAIDEFIRLALDTKTSSVLTLAQFIHRLEAMELEIKRDMESAGNAVRVMTVHAAKGLEAKIVYLPDTCSDPGGGPATRIIDINAGTDERDSFFIWRQSKQNDPSAIAPVFNAMKVAEAEEHRRLLYVAMTRAEERLYIGGFYIAKKPDEQSWYRMIETELAEVLTPVADDTSPAIEGVQTIGSPSLFVLSTSVPSLKTVAAARPDWLRQPAAIEKPAAPPVRPSTALASADQLDPPVAAVQKMAEPSSGAAIGILVHELLYRLADLNPSERDAAARRYLDARGEGLQETVRKKLAAQVLELLESPALAPIFAQGSRAEVAIAGTLNGGRHGPIDITGRIDRMRVTPEAVLVADFKTGQARPAAETPPAYVRQMALYRGVLQTIFPGRLIQTILVWTGGPAVVELPAEMLDRALAAVLETGPQPKLS